MSVSNMRDATMENVRALSKFRLNWQARTINNTDVQLVAEDAAPVQIVTTTGTGPAVLRLPLSAPNGTVFFVRNMGTQGLNVTDDAGTPVLLTLLAANTGGAYIKQGAAYTALYESAAIA